jgi:hypothetical protein
MPRFTGNEIDGGGADLGTINVTPNAQPQGATSELTREQRMAQLKAEREGRMVAAAEERAASDPMRDPTNRPEAPAADEDFIYYYSWIGGTTTGQWKLYRAPKNDTNQATYGSRAVGGATQGSFSSAVGANTLQVQPKPIKDSDGNITGWSSTGNVVSGGGKVETGRVTNPDGSTTITYNDGTTSVIPAPNANSGNVNTGNANTGNANAGNANTGNIATGPTLAKDVFKQTLALYFGNEEVNKGWMDELYNVVSKFYRNGTDVATSLNMALLDARNNPNLKTFTDRFKGIYALQDLRQSGKPVSVPTIAEYVAAQKGMADIFNEAGLGEVATEQFTGDLIGKGNSVSTIADKVARVFQRIDMAPKEIKDTLSRYFPTVDRTTLAKTILLGQKGVTQLVDELNKYDVLAAAEQQGIAATGAKGIAGGVTEERAGEYARGGGTYESLLPKFAQVKRVTPELAKLSGISKVQDIGQLGVEQAIISGLSQPMETIQKLGEEEIGRFSGKAGRADMGLASQRRANRAF